MVQRSSYWNMREVSSCVSLPALPPDAPPQEYLLVATTYQPNVQAAFSLVVRSDATLAVQIDADPWADYVAAYMPGVWRGGPNGAVGGGAPSQKTFVDNPQFVLTTTPGEGAAETPRKAAQVGPTSSGGAATPATYVTLRIVEESRKSQRGVAGTTGRVEKWPKLGLVEIRNGGDSGPAEGARRRLDRKPPKSWVVAEAKATALEVCLRLPEGWEKPAQPEGDGALILVPWITPRKSSSQGGSARSCNFELSVMSNEGAECVLAQAAMGGSATPRGGPFANKPKLGGKR